MCATHARSLPIWPAGSTFPRWPGWPCSSRSSQDAPIWAYALRELFWTVPADAEPGVSLSRHDWFGGMMWMVARVDPADPDALVLAAKGGNNQEMHNQNDVGNFIVHVNGESIIPDIGRGRYTKQYFGPERYDHSGQLVVGPLGARAQRPTAGTRPAICRATACP